MITIEKINGVPHTVVWHGKPNNPLSDWQYGALGTRVMFCMLHGKRNYRIMATALPPLPRHPTEADAPLLFAYASHGIEVWATRTDFVGKGFTVTGIAVLNMLGKPLDITHAMHKGERVAIAIDTTKYCNDKGCEHYGTKHVCHIAGDL